ncbi:SEC-C metal-binding domain-containing protein [Paraburkholderia sp. BL21I4N1]|uniref:SEC-C metal-binding domain-containing protein n=1 Tax=Paraburkholderia sp. BL21I4N1 TaxID=1938801 RepID=UPI000CFD8339|nr:SEC-C metal-binding domain-containing protein [Paraburkholderia sp. BL21I4N1]
MNSMVMELPLPTLDPAQEVRIAAVHRGFLYQHLYTVGCLFRAAAAGATSVVVERDEDVEIVLPSRRIYVQVKSRSQPIIPSDIDSALERFSRLRAEHVAGRRGGVAHFAIVANQAPGPALAALIASGSLEGDIQFLCPGQPVPAHLDALPPAWRNLGDAVQWCTAQAASLPHAMLVPDSLVWKLAGLVMSAATGQMQRGGHAFAVETLPELFEQLLVQLQDFPAPLVSYRPQIDEPDIDNSARLRIICGFSGAGKTSWASQAATHSRESCVYFNAGDTPGTALASSLVRELAASLVGAAPDVLRQVLLPGVSGIDSLRSLDVYLAERGRAPIIVIDNAHQVPADHIHAALGATGNLRFLLLCQPAGSTRELEALLGITRETLRGWDMDTLASEIVAIGARGSAETMGRLSQQTAGMPLFVQSAARIAVQDYAGDAAQLCDALDSRTNIGETSQEVILSRTFDGLPSGARDVVAVLSLADVVLKLEEVNEMLSASLGLSEPAIASVVRMLRSLGIVEIFGGKQLKIHDAVSLLGRRHLELMSPEHSLGARRALRDVLSASLTKERDASRFSLYVRTLISLKEIDTIIEFASDEMFHEMGIGDVFLASLETAAASIEVDPEQRFWALDGLVFAKLKSGDLTSLPERLARMEELLGAHVLPRSTQLALGMKRMLLKAQHRDLPGVRASIAELGESLPDSQQHQRIFKYNAATALWRLGEGAEAERLVEEVIQGYLDELGISEAWIFGKSQQQLRPLLDRSASSTDDVKHLADALELRSILLKDRGVDPGLWRLFAMKFYALVGAVDSAVRVGQDVADDFVARHDFIGAREILEQHVLPFAEHYRMLDRIVAIRSQYAVVLGYCRDFSAAEQEIQRLEAYAGGFSAVQRQEIDGQRALIADLRAGNGPQQRRVFPSRANFPAVEQRRNHRAKVGRNDPCPCGSGQKYKKCHG